jgi:hypothetical protein
MTAFTKALGLLKQFCDEAGVIEQPTITFTFKDKREKAYFMAHFGQTIDAKNWQYAEQTEGATFYGFKLFFDETKP